VGDLYRGVEALSARADLALVVLRGAPIDAALKRLKRQCEKAGIFHELKVREAFVPLSARRRRKAMRARKRLAKWRRLEPEED